MLGDMYYLVFALVFFSRLFCFPGELHLPSEGDDARTQVGEEICW